MQVAEVKTSATASPRIQAKRQPFFSKEGQGSFFSKSNEGTQSFFSPTTVQPKLIIGRPNDKYEVEADAMADKVVQRLSETSTNDSSEGIVQTKSSGTSVIQPKCHTCEHEERIQEKEVEFSEAKRDIHTKLSLVDSSESLDEEQDIQSKSLTIENKNLGDLNKTIIQRVAQTNTEDHDISLPEVESEQTGNSGSTQSPPPDQERRECGPNVNADVTRIWNSVRSDFSGWSDIDKLAACLYLVSPFVPQGDDNPRSSSGSSFLSGSVMEPFIGIMASIMEMLGYSINILDSQRWQLNRDAFDTIGLFVLSADWIRELSQCAQPSCEGLSSDDLPRGHSDPCEGPSLCSFTVEMGNACWLAGTANYGTYGIMMRLAFDWCMIHQRRLTSLLPEIVLRSYGSPATALRLLRASMSREEIIAAMIYSMFSQPSLIAYVGGYKLWDMENPVDPVNWALATYMGGATSRPAGTNRPNCPTTCAENGNLFNDWDYVWEPVKHRD